MRGLTVWFTGLSSTGKSTISNWTYAELKDRYDMEWLDGDAVRESLSKDLGFSKADRDENIRRIGEAAERYTRQGKVVLVSAISPYREARDKVRQKISAVGDFLEVYVNAPLEVCASRDIKGLYRRAKAGESNMWRAWMTLMNLLWRRTWNAKPTRSPCRSRSGKW